MGAADAHAHGHTRRDKLGVVARRDRVCQRLPRDLACGVHFEADGLLARTLAELLQLLLALSRGVAWREPGLCVAHHLAAPIDLACGYRRPRRVCDDRSPRGVHAVERGLRRQG